MVSINGRLQLMLYDILINFPRVTDVTYSLCVFFLPKVNIYFVKHFLVDA